MEEPPVRSFAFALSLFAVLLAPALARAESVPVPATMGQAPKSGIIGLDAMTGTVFQQGQSSFSGIALRLRVRHPALVPNVEILPTFEYWQNTSHVDAFDIETKRRDAALTADVRWMFQSRPWKPYLGAGFGLHFLDSEVRAPSLGLPHGSEGVIKGGLDVLGGIQSNPEARLGSFLEFKFINVTAYRQFKFSTGLAWNF
jgi:hypothetical protein